MRESLTTVDTKEMCDKCFVTDKDKTWQKEEKATESSITPSIHFKFHDVPSGIFSFYLFFEVSTFVFVVFINILRSL